MKSLRMPRHVDDPKTFIVFTVDELVPVGAGLITGVIVEQIFLCTLIGVALAKFLRRYIDTQPDGYILHLLYWWAVAPMGKPTRAIPSALRRYWGH